MNESQTTEKVEKTETQVTTPTLVPTPVPTTETKSTERVEESTTVEKK